MSISNEMKKVLIRLMERAAGLRGICWGRPAHVANPINAREVGKLVMGLPDDQREALKDLRADDLQKIHHIADIDPSAWYRDRPYTAREKRSKIFTHSTKK